MVQVKTGRKIFCISHWRSGAFIFILVALMAGYWTGCSYEPPPHDIIGDWVARDDRFEGRVLRITSKAVEITVDGELVSYGLIVGSKTVHEKGWLKIMLTLEDLSENGSSIILNYNKQKDNLWLENRPDVIWYRFEKDT